MAATSQFRRQCTWPALALAGVLTTAASAAGQARPLPNNPPPQLRAPLEKPLPPAASADLYIKRVEWVGPSFGYPGGHATIWIGNAGNAPAEIPAGTVLLKTESRPGALSYAPLPASTVAQTVRPTGETMVGLDLRDYCSAGALPDTVTFTLDPDGRVSERKDNNTFKAMPTAPDIRKADLVVSAMKFIYPTLNHGPNDPLDLVVTIKNVGTAPALIMCKLSELALNGLFKEIESPVSGKYGLRTYQWPNLPRTIEPGQTFDATLRNAYRATDLQPGSYVWKVQIDPQAYIAESNRGNNVGSTTVTVPPGN